VDYSATCDVEIAVAQSLAASGKLQEALDTYSCLKNKLET